MSGWRIFCSHCKEEYADGRIEMSKYERNPARVDEALREKAGDMELLSGSLQKFKEAFVLHRP